MKYSEAKQGRVFIMRLEDGETVHEEIEKFAEEHSIKAAALIILGGADEGSKLVVGPEMGRARPIKPMQHILDNVHEVAGTGTLFPDQDGKPALHMHMACGRSGNTVTGCIRGGVKVWQIMEIVLFELVDTAGKRTLDPDLGFKLLTFH
jgi:predicted DNA-binding protein with PD1-like motif